MSVFGRYGCASTLTAVPQDLIYRPFWDSFHICSKSCDGDVQSMISSADSRKSTVCKVLVFDAKVSNASDGQFSTPRVASRQRCRCRIFLDPCLAIFHAESSDRGRVASARKKFFCWAFAFLVDEVEQVTHTRDSGSYPSSLPGWRSLTNGSRGPNHRGSSKRTVLYPRFFSQRV